MRKFFLSAIAVTLIPFCTDALAQDFDNSCCDEYECSEDNLNFYAEVYGGSNYLQTETSGGIKSNFKTGYILGGSLGYRFCYGVRLEAEYAFRKNSYESVHFFGRTFSMDGHFQSSSIMANLLWDIPFASWGWNLWNVQPIIGAGIGYDSQKIRGVNETMHYDQTCRQFAWQMTAGLSYPLFSNIDIAVEYKFHKGGFNYIYDHSVVGGLTVKLGYH